MRYLKDFFSLLYPTLCATCDTVLLQSETVVCTLCRHDLPILPYTSYTNNRVAATFYGKVPVQMAVSFLAFHNVGKTKELIHRLKYKGQQEIGAFLGDWMGSILQQSGKFKNIDVIIPVPLHAKKFRKRGYNQLTTFGKQLSEQLDVPYNDTLLVRTSSTHTQTLQQRFERFNNVNTKFLLTDTALLKNQHILLIDDVITTGATMEACCLELLKTPKTTVSVVSMAFVV